MELAITNLENEHGELSLPFVEKINMEDSKPSSTEPDPDTIKMFVGQIPRHWNEPECRKLFEKYGPVYSLNILRDKASQSSKGCCFVTYYHRKDAIAAQAALHNIEVIEGMHHPVQMKPADTENRNERKLFIGQLSKKHTEEEVRALFARFGHIEDCSVLRDTDNRSRGCAFVTFASRNCAINATKEMHHSQTMEGCTAPLVVKFADTQRDKDGKGKSQSTPPATAQPISGQANILQQLTGNGINIQTLTALAALLQPSGQQQNVLGLLGSVLSALGKLSDRENGGSITSVPASQTQSNGNSSSPPNSLPQLAALLQQSQPQGIDALAQLQQVQLAQQHQQMLALLNQQQQQQAAAAVVTQDQSQTNNLAYQSYQGAHVVAATTAGTNAYAVHNPIYQTAGGVISQNGLKTTSPVAITTPALAHISQNATQIDPLQQAIHQYALTSINPTIAVQAATAAGVGNGDVKGPDGSNLFIYHLPQDFGDTDLMSTFAPFGTVLSAKVFIDKVTNLSKCFGFVSYDNALSAQNAISAMNGFQIGSKRLKVQLKNERNHPYAKVN